jgi:hypothetical protein
MNLYQKAKDIFLQRRTPQGKFEESPLIVEPNSVVGTNACNDLIMIPISSISSSAENYFLKNETISATSSLNNNASIFNPSNLLITSSSIFIIDANCDYYVLGDLINSGSVVVNGTLKIGGVLFNAGSILGIGNIQ